MSDQHEQLTNLDSYFAAEEVVKRIRTQVLHWDGVEDGSRAKRLPDESWAERAMGPGSCVDISMLDGSCFEITVRMMSPARERRRTPS